LKKVVRYDGHLRFVEPCKSFSIEKFCHQHELQQLVVNREVYYVTELYSPPLLPWKRAVGRVKVDMKILR